MAELRLQDGSRITDAGRIAERLAPLGVALRQWPVPESARARALLAAQALADPEKEELLGLVEHRFQALRAEAGYQARDLVVLHEDLPGLAEALAKFSGMHYHDDDEVRYVLAGAGYFGFVGAGGEQMLLKVEAGDYINVPARAEHWFVMGDAPRIKAVRYFTDKAGWVPVYTHYPRRPGVTAADTTASPVIATYRFPPGVDAARQAEVIAVGQTLGSADAHFAGREQALAACRAQVLEVRADGDGALASVAFPAANTEGDIGTLLTMVFGKYSLAGPARLVDLRLPADFGTRPRFGIDGLRARLSVVGRPLLMAIFKPALGLTAADHAALLRTVADTELDLIKDDEILGNLAQAPTLERFRACRPVIEAIRDRRGRDFLYAVNVTGRADALIATARRLVAQGANALLLNVLVYGYPMLEALAADPEIGVPILAHPALAGALALAPDYGIDYRLVLGRLMRRAGADIVLHPARFGSLPFSAADEARVIAALTGDDSGWPRVFPGPSAGIKPAIVPALLADYGRDLVINAGSAIFDAGRPPKAAVEAFLEAMEVRS